LPQICNAVIRRLEGEFHLIHIYIDADACPVKDEIYKVAERYSLQVTVVANSFLRVPDDPLIERVIVNDKFDAADDYIAERANQSSIVITSIGGRYLINR
jgi:uncharacterized protein YaiI (UPF0178 family)